MYTRVKWPPRHRHMLLNEACRILSVFSLATHSSQKYNQFKKISGRAVSNWRIQICRWLLIFCWFAIDHATHAESGCILWLLNENLRYYISFFSESWMSDKREICFFFSPAVKVIYASILLCFARKERSCVWVIIAFNRNNRFLFNFKLKIYWQMSINKWKKKSCGCKTFNLFGKTL